MLVPLVGLEAAAVVDKSVAQVEPDYGVVAVVVGLLVVRREEILSLLAAAALGLPAVRLLPVPRRPAVVGDQKQVILVLGPMANA